MDTGLSEQYIFLRSEARGKKKLNAIEVNPFLRKYRRMLESFKIEERKSNGKRFKIWTDNVDEFTSELLNDGKTLLFSQKIKLNIYDPRPHTFNNYMHGIQAKISQGLEKIRMEDEKITIVTTGIKFAGGGEGTGRWPMEKTYGIGI